MIKKKSQDRKRQRYIKKIYDLIKDRNALFITMSFNDAVLSKTSAETRKRYIKEFLKNETALYIANIDYGAKNGREHYHAIARTTTLNNIDAPYRFMLNIKAYKYGDIRADFIGKKYGFKDNQTTKETAKHLYNHAIKETTKNNKVIFSRCAPSESKQLERIKRFVKDNDIKEQPRTNETIILFQKRNRNSFFQN